MPRRALNAVKQEKEEEDEAAAPIPLPPTPSHFLPSPVAEPSTVSTATGQSAEVSSSHAVEAREGDGDGGVDEDDGAIEIADMAAEDEALLESNQDISSLLGTTNVLTGGEEAPPLLTSDYAAAFFNTDPRIAFDALHIGALRAIEKAEGMTRSSFDYPPWFVPPADYVGPTGSLGSSVQGTPCFHVRSMHPLVQSRPPIDRADHAVDALLTRPTRDALTAAIGLDILEQLRIHRGGEGRRRSRAKRSPAHPAKGA